MTMMMLWVSAYAAVYAVFINPIYGVLQLFVVLTIPLLKMYNGEQGTLERYEMVFLCLLSAPSDHLRSAPSYIVR